MSTANSIGIAAGLVAGKPLGIALVCFIAVAAGLCRLPPGLNRVHVVGAGMLGGIGFTMSIFISHLAFPLAQDVVNASKIAILLASLTSGVMGFLWLRCLTKPLVRAN